MRIFIKHNGVIEFHPDKDEVLHLEPKNDFNCKVVAYDKEGYDVPESILTTNNIVDQLKRDISEKSEKQRYDMNMREFLRQSELSD